MTKTPKKMPIRTRLRYHVARNFDLYVILIIGLLVTSIVAFVTE